MEEVQYRKGNTSDITDLIELAIDSWSQFRSALTKDNWEKLLTTLSSPATYSELLTISECLVCENDRKKIIGMAFLVPSGNPTEIYDKDWCYLRFVSVQPKYRGNGIGEELTRRSIALAVQNDENIMALHTSVIMKSARHIYEKLGFSIHKELEPRLGLKYHLYTLKLGKIST